MPTAEYKRDYYEVLGVDRTATRDQLKQAYRRLALQYHPDRNKAPNAATRFREIAEAYAVLSDDAKRREYDATGHAGVSERWTTEDLVRGFQFGDFFGGRFDDLFGIFGDVLSRRTRPGQGAVRGKVQIPPGVDDGMIVRLAGVLAWWVPGSRDVINGMEVVPPQEDSDNEVAKAVRLVLKKDPLVNEDRIRVSARNSVVTLEGDVPTDAQKEMAEFDAWYVFGVDKVINKLTVR